MAFAATWIEWDIEGQGETLCSPGCSTSGVRKNARFAHIMVNFGLVVHRKRFSAHEAVFLITRQ